MEKFKLNELAFKVMELDLLELSSENEDQSANSWIWISGEKFRKKINRILD